MERLNRCNPRPHRCYHTAESIGVRALAVQEQIIVAKISKSLASVAIAFKELAEAEFAMLFDV